MLLCRRLHFKTQIRKTLISTPSCSHTFSYSPNYLISAPHEPKAPPVQVPTDHIETEREDKTLVNQLFDQVHNGGHRNTFQESLNYTFITKRELSKNFGSVDIYLRIRERHRHQLSLLSPAVFIHVFRQAFKESLDYVVDIIITDTTNAFRNEPGKLSVALVAFLKHLCRLPEGQRQRIFTIFKSLPDAYDRKLLPHEIIVHVAKAIMLQPEFDCMQYLPFLESIIPMLLQGQKSRTPFRTANQLSYNIKDEPIIVIGNPPPEDFVWLSLRLVHLLTEANEEERALNVFQLLIESGRISEEFIEEADRATESFKLVILSVITRTCIRRGWWNGAAQLLAQTTITDAQIASHVSGLVIEIFESFYSSGTRHDVENCCKLILSLINEKTGVTLPDEQVLLFYDFARHVGRGDLAEKIYFHLRSGALRRTREYPHPRGPALPYLMNRLIKNSINIHGARILAQHVVESGESVSLSARAPMVKLCASKGFKTEARALWERFSSGKDRDAVIGHSGTMLRMVSVFTRDERRSKHVLSPRNRVYKAQDPDSGDANDVEDVDESTAITDDAYRDLSHSGEAASSNGTVISSTLSHIDDYDDDGVPERPASSPVSSSLPHDDVNPDDSKSLEDREEYMAFARHIVEEYRKSKLPLEKASHLDINALARAYSMLDDLTGCLDTLKVILRRKEIPDLFDINVALAAMARHDPSRAFFIVIQMIQKGLHPNEITFATIIHEALALGDRELVGRIMRLATELGFGGLTESAVASLLRLTLVAVGRRGSFTLPKEETAKTTLKRTFKFIVDHRKSMYIHTPNMGKVGIAASLRADEPEMAFKFWKMLVRDRTEWEYDVQVSLRRGIADKIRMHYMTGKLDMHRGRRMLDELGEELEEERTV